MLLLTSYLNWLKWVTAEEWVLSAYKSCEKPAITDYMLLLLQSEHGCTLHGFYLIDLHSLLWGPGLRVGSSEDPELSFDQGAVGQVDPTDIKVDDSVVGAGCYWLHRV